MVNIKKLEKLYKIPNFQHIENTITNELNSVLYKDDLTKLRSITKDNIENSILTLQDIENCIINHPNTVIKFGILFLGETDSEILGTGIAILYSMYVIYLKEKSQNELLFFIQKIGIPESQKVLEELWSIKKEMNI